MGNVIFRPCEWLSKRPALRRGCTAEEIRYSRSSSGDPAGSLEGSDVCLWCKPAVGRGRACPLCPGISDIRPRFGCPCRKCNRAGSRLRIARSWHPMLDLCRLIFAIASDLLRSRVALEAEILVLRQQINRKGHRQGTGCCAAFCWNCSKSAFTCGSSSLDN